MPDSRFRKDLVLPDEHHATQDFGVLDRVGAENPNAAGRRKLLAGEDAKERRLARAVGTEQPGDRPVLDIKGDVVQSTMVAIAAGEVGDRDHRRHTVTPPRALLDARTSASSSSVSIPSLSAS